MMTDYEKLKALLAEFGVGFYEDVGERDDPLIVCEKGETKIGGYSGFLTIFSFDKDGKFIEMGAWE